jgi:hypothetical protein
VLTETVERRAEHARLLRLPQPARARTGVPVSRKGVEAREQAVKSVKKAGRRAANAIQVLRDPLYAPPGNYLSPLSSQADIDRAIRAKSDLPGIVLDEEAQLDLLKQLAGWWSDVPEGGSASHRYYSENAMYGLADAAVYFGMLRYIKPKRIIEVGCGLSSAVAMDYADAYDSDLSLTFIEPNPQRLESIMRPSDRSRCTVIDKQVQDVDLSVYAALEPGDALFIDSSHIVKPGSDVNWLYLEVLPTLPSGTFVHIHDIFWPFEYPVEWLQERRDWTEGYLLRALLTDSDRWRVLLFSNWLWQNHRELFRGANSRGPGPGSFWMVRQ